MQKERKGKRNDQIGVAKMQKNQSYKYETISSACSYEFIHMLNDPGKRILCESI